MPVKTPEVRTEHEPAAREPVSAMALWAAILAGPLAIAAMQESLYILTGWSCMHGTKWPMHLTAILFAFVPVGAALLAMRNWRAAGLQWPGTDGGALPRARFMAAVGFFSGIAFFIVAIALWLPVLGHLPCPRAG